MVNQPTSVLQRYAKLLVHYCLELQAGERLYIQTTTLAEPLVKALYEEALKVGASVDYHLSIQDSEFIYLNHASDFALAHVSPLQREAMMNYDAYLAIRAPFNLRSTQNVQADKAKKRRDALAPVHSAYFDRTADRRLKRCLCQFPTVANAQEAGMSLSEYEYFIYNACNLFTDDPQQAWLNRRHNQQRIVDKLNQASIVRYKSPKIDISFSTVGRTWINSDGQTNMPSGEVYTSPVEDSVNGYIHFDYPAIYQGNLVEGVTLEVNDGYITSWKADQGQDFLDHIFSIEGTRRFGEAAIGTNYEINQFTRNILFDEKIGGTVHMAIGQSYLQAGGKNESSVHWDMIADMKTDSQIFADNEEIYKNGNFTF